MDVKALELDYLQEVKENTMEIKELLKSILATLEVLEDRLLLDQIKESEEEIKKGEYERFI